MPERTGPAVNNNGRTLRTPDGVANFAHLERAIAGTPRPFVVVTERELSVLRRGLTKDGWKRSLYLQPAPALHGILVGAGMLSVANRWLETDIAIPPRAGWYHDFHCDCGECLTVADGVQLASDYRCAACGKTYSGPEYDGAVHYIQHNHLAGAARSLGIVYGIEKDRVYAEKTAEILMKYARAYPGPHTDFVTGGMYRQSLDEAVWIIALAQAYDLIYYSRCITDDDRDQIERNLFRAVAEGLSSLPTTGSWGAWHLAAMGVVGLAIKDASLVRRALRAFETEISEELGDDGLWPESLDYHFYVLTAFIYLAEACQRAGIDIYNWEPKPGKSLKTMFSAALDLIYPSFRMPAIHDACFDAVLPLDLYEIAHRRWDDASFAWVLKAGYKYGDQPALRFHEENRGSYRRTSFYAFLFGRDLPGRTGMAVLKGRDFHNLGLCTLRGAGDLMATLDYGRFMDHGHLDKLSFTLFANGALMVPDYGSPGYGSELMTWSESTAGHNTVVVDGLDQQQSRTTGLMRHHTGGYVQYAEAIADDIYPDVVHRRRMVVLGSACIVADHLSSGSERDYDWVMRCEGTPRVMEDYPSARVDTPGYRMVEQDRAFAIADCGRVRWDSGDGELLLHMWPGSGAGGVVLGACPTQTGARSASFYLCRQRAADTSFVAAFAAVKNGSNVDLTRNGCVLRIRTEDLLDELYLRGCGEPAPGLLETDGEVAAVRSVDGNAVAVALVNGSWVRWNGEMLLECPCVVDCVEFLGEVAGPIIKYSCDTGGIVKIQTNARAMKVNGFRASATRSDRAALVRITPEMLLAEARSMSN